jgi:hypothetical protein
VIAQRAIALAVIATLTSCSGSGMLFAKDRRVTIESPDQNGKVTLPLEVKWTLEPDAKVASFALFFDGEPQAPKKPLAVLAKGDPDCEATPGCPNAAYFADRGIFTTAKTAFVIDDLLPLAGVDIERGERDVHDVTIVVLDEQGRRVNEAFWSRTFEIVRP